MTPAQTMKLVMRTKILLIELLDALSVFAQYIE